MTTNKAPITAPVERILHVRGLPALEALPQVLLAAIAQRANERFFRQGTLVVDPNLPVAATYIVIDGHIAATSAGREAVHAGTGEAVGFLELLARLEGGLEARAVSDTLALEVDWDAHVDLCDDHFPILHAHLHYLAEQLSLRTIDVTDGTRMGSSQARGLHNESALDLVQRVLALGHDDAFSTSSPDALVELARHAAEVRYERGDPLWHLHDASVDFFLLTGGSVTCEAADGRRWACEPTIALGLHEALAELPRAYSAQASTAVTGLTMPMEPVLDVLEDHLELGMHLMSQLARQLLGRSGSGE